MAPNTEAPSEHMMYFPQFKLLNIAEDAVHNLHNILTLRGAQIRDAYEWWKDIDKAIRAFGDKYEVCIGQHHWPTWGMKKLMICLFTNVTLINICMTKRFILLIKD